MFDKQYQDDCEIWASFNLACLEFLQYERNESNLTNSDNKIEDSKNQKQEEQKESIIFDYCILSSYKTSMISLLLSVYNFKTKCILNIFSLDNLGYANKEAIEDYFNLNFSYYSIGLTRFNDRLSYLKTGILSSYKIIFLNSFLYQNVMYNKNSYDNIGYIFDTKRRDVYLFDNSKDEYLINFKVDDKSKTCSKERIIKYLNLNNNLLENKHIFTYISETNELVEPIINNINSFALTDSLLFVFTNKKEYCTNRFTQLQKEYKNNVIIVDTCELGLKMDLILTSDFLLIDQLNVPLIKNAIKSNTLPIFYNKNDIEIPQLGFINSFSFSTPIKFSKQLFSLLSSDKTSLDSYSKLLTNTKLDEEYALNEYKKMLVEDKRGKISKK